MPRHPILTPAHIPEIRQLVKDGMPDSKIGARFGASQPVVCAFRKKHGIPARKGKKGNPSWGWNAKNEAPAIPPGEVTTYTDEHGRKITKYPPGYAVGVEAGATAKGNSRY